MPADDLVDLSRRWGQGLDALVDTDKNRYHSLARDMQAVARRLLICGMHVHVGIDDDELRIDLTVSCREIIRTGTSAHRQIACYEAALAAGASPHDALCGVVDMLIDQILRGT